MKFSAAVLLSLTTLSMPATIEAVARNTKHDSMSRTKAPGFVSGNSRKSPKQNRMSSKKTAAPTDTPTSAPTSCLKTFVNEIDRFGREKQLEFVIVGGDKDDCTLYKLQFVTGLGADVGLKLNTFTTKGEDAFAAYCVYFCSAYNCIDQFPSTEGGVKILDANDNVVQFVSWGFGGGGDPGIEGATYIGNPPADRNNVDDVFALTGTGCCYAEFISTGGWKRLVADDKSFSGINKQQFDNC